jgi:uncharacterized protein
LKRSTEFAVPLEAGVTTALAYPADGARATLILAHGAGAGQRHPFMVAFASAISAAGIDVVTFNFPYIEQKRRAPDRAPVLEECFARVIDAVSACGAPAGSIVIGGKSMGGRIATQLAAADRVRTIAGIVLLGYPLHPPGRPHELRVTHLPAVRRPMLFVQGTRDAFGTPGELEPILTRLQPTPRLLTVDGADHSFKLSKKDPAGQAAVYAEIQRAIIAWIEGISGSRARAR